MNEQYYNEFVMSHFLLSIFRKVPLKSTWYICDFMQDIWSDFPDIDGLKNFYVKDNKYDSGNNLIIGIEINDDFIKWFEYFIKKNHLSWCYWYRHFVSNDETVYFVALESNNLVLLDDLNFTKAEINEISALDNYISVETNLDSCFYPPSLRM